ncbi:MAG: hypothetical protein Q7V45_26720 [Reyranella sp.]|nr:hypothetical protein [Reyranella sp.]MDO8977543.1 hypothetical protein [Reyranella sp.]
MLGVLARLVLVEGVDDLSDQVAVAVLAQFLGDGDQSDTSLGQFPDVELGVHGVAAEAAERMHNHEVIRPATRRSPPDHFLEYWAVLVERRRARLGEDVHDGQLLAGAIVPKLLDLVRQGQVGLCLPHG